jgi:hypothetical protein
MGFLQHHGFHIMMTGLAMIAVCAFLCCFFFIRHQLTRDLNNQIFSVAFGGLIVYAAGRVLTFLENKRQKAEPGNKDTV